MLTTNIRMKIFGVVLSFTVAGSALAEENDWQDIDLPLTQKQFCLVYESNVEALNTAINSRNDIKMNVALDNIEQDLISLLPSYQYENWVGRMRMVSQGVSGNVGVEVSIQCNLSLVSGTGSKETSNATRSISITPDSRLYRELSKLDYNDYVLMSGRLIDFENGPDVTDGDGQFRNSGSFIVNMSKLSKYYK